MQITYHEYSKEIAFVFYTSHAPFVELQRITVPREHFDCAAVIETKEPKVTRERSPMAYRLDRPVAGILSIRPIGSATTSDAGDEDGCDEDGDGQSTKEAQFFVVLYTSDHSINFCKFLKFERTNNEWQ